MVELCACLTKRSGSTQHEWCAAGGTKTRQKVKDGLPESYLQLSMGFIIVNTLRLRLLPIYSVPSGYTPGTFPLSGLTTGIPP
jgi:hypothetical protein